MRSQWLLLIGLLACDSTSPQEAASPQPLPLAQPQPQPLPIAPPPPLPQAQPLPLPLPLALPLPLPLPPAPAPAPPLPLPRPACEQTKPTVGPWPRASSLVRVMAGKPGKLGWLEQTWQERPFHLRFLGAHLFDLLDKIVHEAGPTEHDKRNVICLALNAMVNQGVPVVRLWGSLKTTGSMAEIELATSTLSLVLSENARRDNPLRFVITLQNHQAGYGAPDSTKSLDDQNPQSIFFSKRFYLGGGWKEKGKGSLADRIEALAARTEIKDDPNILGFELVNELDTFRHIARGTFEGPEAESLRIAFAIAALTLLAERLPQPVLLGDIRGHQKGYIGFQERLVGGLPAAVKHRLVWTTHVYTTHPSPDANAERERATAKLNQDIRLARSFGLPLLLGELGQHVVSSSKPASSKPATSKPAPRLLEDGFCQDNAGHDIPRLFADVLDPNADIEAALLWGEGLCNLAVQDNKRISIGAGADSADIGTGENEGRRVILEKRGAARFQARLSD